MKAATIHDLKNELNSITHERLTELCLRLAKFKKENKELLTYLLFEAHDEQAYIENVKKEIDDQFTGLPRPTLYLTKKSLRKILRTTNKFIRYTGSSLVDVQLLIYFCGKLKKSGIPIHKNRAIINLYQHQLEKIDKVLAMLHEDLQYDYLKELEQLK